MLTVNDIASSCGSARAMFHRHSHSHRTDFLGAMVLVVGVALVLTIAVQVNLLA